jgi:hypothetical protein
MPKAREMNSGSNAKQNCFESIGDARRLSGVLVLAVRNGLWPCLAALCLTGLGCSEGPLRLPVSGSVELDGKPLATGSLLMVPTKTGPVAGCDIKDGQFEMPTDRGPGPGEYRVEITAYRPTGRKVYDSDLNASTETLEPIIPVRYNTQSELTATISLEAENRFTFDLKSK